MKFFRRLYYIIMAISLIAGMYTGMRAYYIIFLTQVFIIIAVLIINFWTIQTFKFKQELSSSICVKGKETSLNLEIVNEKPFPLSLIEVHIDVVSRHQDIWLVFSLAPYSGKTFSVPITTPYRGRYFVGMTKLRITDVFGLVSFPYDMRWLSYYKMRELVVLPKAQMPGKVSADIIDTKLFSDGYLKQAEAGDSVSGARLYREGDSLKRVHWKKSAQQGELFVKQYEYPERERVLILVDTAAYGLVGEEALIYADTICECAASIALHSLSRNHSICILNSSGHLRPLECSSLFGFDKILRHLAMLQFDDKADLRGALEKTNRSFKEGYALFVLTRGKDSASMQRLECILETYKTVTMIIVGGSKPAGHTQTIYMDAGSNAAESLRSLF
jgi:uncharacterized protein (DUF58 family)